MTRLLSAVFFVGLAIARIPTEQTDSKLYGSFSSIDCTLSQTNSLTDAHLNGTRIAMMPEFGACIEARMTHSYLKCLEPQDPFFSDPIDVQRTRALTIMRSSNTAALRVTCDELSGIGEAGYDSYGTSSEDIKIDSSWLTDAAVNGLNDWERADVAGVLWHEAMHQQTYKHSDDGDSTPCGYASTDVYSRGINSVPYMSDRCMRSAGIHARVMAFDDDTGQSQEFGVGRHRAAAGHFISVGDNTIDRLRVGPGLLVRYCLSDGLAGDGLTCTDVVNDSIEYRGLFTVPEANQISWIEVTPRVLVFTDSHFGGSMQVLGYGEHLANEGDFTIPNDSITSIYVPAGARVRACRHENGPGGHGLECLTYDDPIALLTSFMNNNISYIEVTKVVTVFNEIDMYGTQASAVQGTYTAADSGLPVGDNTIASIVVPNGLTAEVCSGFSGSNPSGTCQTHARSTATFGTLDNTISFLRVTPTVTPTTLTVSRVSQGGAALGRVVSAPLGIDCGADCSGSYERRTEIRLRAFPATDTQVAWTNCDRISANYCWVTMMAARTVTATFSPIPQDPNCYDECLEGCLADGGLHSQCVPACNAACNN